jgi:ATP-binding cassette subfamily A (ABC1) protein 3
MINGRFVCFGSINQLKADYSEGYQLIIKRRIVDGAKFLDDAVIKQRIAEHFKDAKIVNEASDQYISYRLPPSGFHFHKVFGEAQKMKEDGIIDDFSLQQCSLEQIFIYFARSQLS